MSAAEGSARCLLKYYNKKEIMKKIFIKIERTRDCYSAYAENVEGIYAGGDTISELKESVNNSIKLIKEYNGDNIPAILKSEYQLVYQYIN